MTAGADHDDMWRVLGQQTNRFWVCVNPDHRYVTWVRSVASCDHCGLTSEHTARWVRATMRNTLTRLADGIAQDYPEAAAVVREKVREIPRGNPYTDPA